MAISTKGIGPMDLSSGINSKNNLKSKAEEGAADSFSSLINMSSDNFKDENDNISGASKTEQNQFKMSNDVNAGNKANNGADKKTDYGAKENIDKNINSRDGEQTEAVNKTSGKNNVDTTSDNGKTEEIQINENLTDADVEEVVENLAEQLAALINQITDILKDMLGIGDEELEENLSVLDMDFSDLLETENISEFVLYTEGATEVDILIDEQLATLVNDITEKVYDIESAFEAFDLESSVLNYNDVEDVVIDVKEIMQKADELIRTPQDHEEVLIAEETIEISDSDESANDTSFISENADNNISEGFRTIVPENNQNTSSRNSSSNNFGSSNESVVNNLNNAINNVVQEEITETDFAEPVSQADIIKQVIDEIKANVSNEVTSLEMRLNPESLGRVQITVSSRNGVMQAQIVAETEAAKNAIEENISALRETLNNQDLKVEDVEVTIASYGFFEGQEQDMPEDNTNGRSSSKNAGINADGDTLDDIGEDELLEEEIMKVQGNSVSYSI